MVFELTDGLARCSQERWRALELCISNLLVGYYEGNLLLIASPLLCSFMEERKLVKGFREHAALNYLKNNNYRPNVLWHIRVVLDSADASRHELNVDFFQKMESVQYTSFLCEHLIDIKFYLRLAKNYHQNSPMEAIERCGGGGATADVLKCLKKKNIICLTIVDSDCKYPKSERPPKGSTADHCKKCVTKCQANIELFILPVHEIENLIPFSYMRQRVNAEGTRFMKRLERNNLLDTMVFYDVKEGIRKKDAKDNKGLMEFAKDLYESLYKGKQSFDAYYNLKKDSDNLFPALCSTMLTDFMSDKMKVYEPDIFDLYRKEIADLVHTFLCCRGNLPIN